MDWMETTGISNQTEVDISSLSSLGSYWVMDFIIK